MNTFILQDALNWSSDSKYIYVTKRFQHWLIIVRYFSRAQNQHFRMVSEGSYDNENIGVRAAESSALPSQEYIFIHIKIEAVFKCNNISQYYCFYCIFDQINAAPNVWMVVY